MMLRHVAKLFVVSVAIAGCAHSPGAGTTGQSGSSGCAAGDAAVCHHLAERVLDGAPGRVVGSYVPELRAGCERGLADACAGLALAVRRKKATDTDDEHLRAQLQASCTAGSSIGCAAWDELRIRAAPNSEDAKRAAREALAQCEKLGGSVCFTAATASFGPEDAATAVSTLERSCATGSSYGCYVLGQAHAEQGDHPAAQKLYAAACENEVAQACFNLGYQRLDGSVGVPDRASAKPDIEKACAYGDPSGCDLLAATNELKVGPDDVEHAYPSDDAALESKRKYCEAGGASSCTEAAFVLGDRAEKSGQLEGMEQVLALLQKGCRRGVMRACNALGHVIRDAQKTCDAGPADQCLIVGYAFDQGVQLPSAAGASVERDAEKAHAAFEKACAHGRQTACARIR